MMKRKKKTERPNKNETELINEFSEACSKAFKQLLSNVRLSLDLRITLNNWLLLMRSAVFIWLVFTLVFGIFIWLRTAGAGEELLRQAAVVAAAQTDASSAAVPAQQAADDGAVDNKAAAAPEEKTVSDSSTAAAAETELTPEQKLQDVIASQATAGTRLVLQNAAGQVVYENWFTAAEWQSMWPQKEFWLFFLERDSKTLYVRQELAVTAADGKWQMNWCCNLRQWQDIYLWGLLVFVAMDVLRAIFFLNKGSRANQKVLQPIAEISTTAQRISADNLDQRINISGTKNELKDLALVINDLLDRLEASYNSQKQFVSDASHELRTPISVIQGYAGLLERWGKSDPRVMEEALSAIVNETASMNVLVENLLFLARHDKQSWNLHTEELAAEEIIEEIARETEITADQHQVYVRDLDFCPVVADRNALKQAVRIFADNSVKYTPAGGKILFGCSREGENAALSVCDTGQGISQEDLAKIFDRFYRADQARSGSGGGHGLGLSIARIIVAAHGGKIRVRSLINGGSEFTILLPLAKE